MEIITLIKRFWKFNEKEAVGHSTVAIYLLLINKWDDNNRLDFSLSDKEISLKLRLSRKTIKTAKDNLRNLGLLNYKNLSGFPCVYKIITDYEFSSKIEIKKEKQTSPHPKISTPSLEESPPPQISSISNNIPSLEEFLLYAKTLEIYDRNSPNLDFQIKAKYESWVENGWKNLNDRKITNWKTSLKSSLPYMIKPKSPRFSGEFTGKAPTIVRPKQTYNE